MQLITFKYFVLKVVQEGKRLQKIGIDGKLTTTSRYTQLDKISFIGSCVCLLVLPKGVSEDFAGFVMAFLGIFIGLFTTIVISLYDKRYNFVPDKAELEDSSIEISREEKDRMQRVRNFFKIFTGLTAYAILLSIFVVILLCLVLLSDFFQANLYNYHLVRNFDEIEPVHIYYFAKVFILLMHRFFIFIILIQFFAILVFSTASYFHFLTTEYKKL